MSHVNFRPAKSHPHLIATLGSEPQVVTTTLDLLTAQGEVFDAVWVVHTSAPGTPIQAAVQALVEAFAGEAQYAGLALRLLPLRDETGALLADVETLPAAQAAFRTLYHALRQAKSAGRRVHLSIAGGRKTMSVYGMAAAQLLFETGDRLWHLHSSGEFLRSRLLHPLPGDDVRLVPIPVLPWSPLSPAMMRLGALDDPFEAAEQARQAHIAQSLAHAAFFLERMLSPAQRRVVRLLAICGESDLEIAQRLSLSPRTVERHLRSAYLKAQLHWQMEDVGRAQLIALLGPYCSLAPPAPNLEPAPQVNRR